MTGKAPDPPLVIVAGPTASGKSALALAVAEAFDGVVINADSMQVYRDLAVLTGRPGPADEARVPHRLYGFLPGGEACSAGRWRDLALAEISEVHGAGRLPVVAGGTGLYLRALERGLSPIPPIPKAERAAARARHAELGAAAFHAALAARDPETAARLDPADSQRLVRAWEVLEATGRPLSDWQRAPAEGTPPYRRLRLVLAPPRPALYAACDRRFGEMMEKGALEEVRHLVALGLDPSLPIMKALGVPELTRLLAGETGREEAIAAARQATRRYAKRQLTWLRTQFLDAAGAGREVSPHAEVGQPREDEAAEAGKAPRATPPIEAAGEQTWVINAQYSETFNPKIFKIIREFLLTPLT
ncbi:MAG: tRNA (adenosine(37)-N6)-dimethylallyltransferase MiaA [Kiloniellales bacterium]